MTYKITLNETQVVVHESVQGPQGPTGASGVVSAADPITYNSTTKEVGFSATGFVKTAIANTFTVGGQIIRTGADAVKGLTLTRNSSSQSANLLSVTGSDGTTELARIRPSGQLGVGGLITNSMLALNGDLLGDNRGIVIKAGVSSPTNNAIEILPLANNTAVLSVTHGGRIGTDGDIFTNGDLTVNGSTGVTVQNNITATGSATVTNLTATTGTATLGTVSNSSKIGTIDLFNGSSGGKSRILPRVGTSATTTNYLPGTAGVIAAIDDITTTNLTGTSLPLVTSVNSTTIPASSTLITSATTSLPNVTSVNGSTIPAAATIVSSSAYRQSQHTPSGSVDIVPRYQVNSTRTLTSGTMQLTGFTPIADMTLNKITTVITAVTGATSMQYGLFTVSGTTVTCVASTATGTPATGILELSFSTGQTLTAGTNYLIGFLAVGGTSATVAGITSQANLALQGNGSSGSVLGPLLVAASSSTTLTAMPSNGATLAIGAGNIASFAYARLN
jgi:hypothetical protein